MSFLLSPCVKLFEVLWMHKQVGKTLCSQVHKCSQKQVGPEKNIYILIKWYSGNNHKKCLFLAKAVICLQITISWINKCLTWFVSITHTQKTRITVSPCGDKNQNKRKSSLINKVRNLFDFFNDANCNNILIAACEHLSYIVWSNVMKEMLNIPCKTQDQLYSMYIKHCAMKFKIKKQKSRWNECSMRTFFEDER